METRMPSGELRYCRLAEKGQPPSADRDHDPSSFWAKSVARAGLGPVQPR